MEIFQGTLPDSRTMYHYYIELADSVRTYIQNCKRIRDLSKVVMNSILEQFGYTPGIFNQEE